MSTKKLLVLPRKLSKTQALILVAVVVAVGVYVVYRGFAGAPTPPPGTIKTVPTFSSLGVYWTVPGGSATTTAQVQYRESGELTWRNALPLWFDSRNGEYRGSIVHLKPGTQYEIELSLGGTTAKGVIIASTWSENFPIGRTVTLPAGTSNTELVIRESGTPSGYLVYTAAPGSQSTIDMRGQGINCITVYGSYVIIRGLNLTGCNENGVAVKDGSHDIVVEENDISNWGRSDNGGPLGVDRDAAVYCSQWQTAEELKTNRFIIQRNKLHNPRYTTNSWATGHPSGPHAITMNVCGENHVIRYNDIYGDDTHYFNDAMGGASNFSDKGFPRADSDIYGNRISHTWDDAIEAEGANRNVRIWGNNIDRVHMAVATRTTSIGPLYIWRNVSARSHYNETLTPDQDNHGSFLKIGSADTTYPAVGKTFAFHNTLLQPKDPAWSRTLGHGRGISDGGVQLQNFVTRNNVFHVWGSSQASVSNSNKNPTNSYDYDLYNGVLDLASGQESHGVRGTPVYRSDNEPNDFALSSSSPGFDAGEVLPNFNDGFVGARPDIGAHEAGTPSMQFGVNAYRSPPDITTPTATLTANPTTVASGAASTLTWSSTNATTCTASGGWTGAKATSNATGESTGPLTATKTYTLICSNAAGVNSSPSSATVSVSTSPTDTTPPTVTWDAPAAGATVSGILNETSTPTCQVTATDSSGIAKVEFYIDDNPTPFETQTTAPFTCVINTAAYPNGTHIIKAKAYDKVTPANSSDLVSRSFNFQNTTPPPPAKQGDINNDNVVNIFDLSILLSNYAKPIAQASDPDCDINANGTVDIFDLSILLSKYGT